MICTNALTSFIYYKKGGFKPNKLSRFVKFPRHFVFCFIPGFLTGPMFLNNVDTEASLEMYKIAYKYKNFLADEEFIRQIIDNHLRK